MYVYKASKVEINKYTAEKGQAGSENKNVQLAKTQNYMAVKYNGFTVYHIRLSPHCIPKHRFTN